MPGNITLEVGQSRWLEANAKVGDRQEGNSPFAFVSDNPAVAAIVEATPGGCRVQGVAAGVTNVVATCAGLSDAVRVRVFAGSTEFRLRTAHQTDNLPLPYG